MSACLVTGANGFVGNHLVAALAERGDAVTALDIDPEARGAARRDGVSYRQVDVRDRAALSRECAGKQVVFHVASVVHTRQTQRDTVWAVNVGGSENVIQACHEGGVGRLIYVSSASTVYEGRDIENGDETMPYASISQAPYADSKIAAEKLVLAADDPQGLRTVAIRPHVVFGPGDRRFLPAILSRAKSGKLKLGVGRGRKLSDFTYVGNLVDALLLADERLAASPAQVAARAYFITNAEPRPFFDFVGQVLGALDLPPVRGLMPFFVAYPVAAVVEAFQTLRGAKLGHEDGLSRFAVRYMCTHHYFSIERARRELGYEPRVSLDEGIALTCRDLRGA
jgi:sterol-4alpha-carboxylate 3-dehydrogenase (decarboxylating)